MPTPPGIVVVTPDGRIARYFYGIDYPARELQAELERARSGQIGSPIGRLLLLCYDYDAATGKYTLSIVRLIRVLGTATVAGAGQLPVRHVPARWVAAPRRRCPAETIAAVRGRSGESRTTRDGPIATELNRARGRHQDHVEFPLIPRSGVEPAWQVDARLLLRVRDRRVLHGADLPLDRDLRGALPPRVAGRPLQPAAAQQGHGGRSGSACRSCSGW